MKRIVKFIAFLLILVLLGIAIFALFPSKDTQGGSDRKTFWVSSSSGSSGAAQNDALTRYYAVSEGRIFTGGMATEAQAQITTSKAGTISGAQVRVITNTHTTANTTFHLRINGANGNTVITVGAGLTGIFEDTTHTDTISADDEIAWQVVTDANAGTTATTWTVMSVVFQANSDRMVLFGGNSDTTVNAASATTYAPVTGIATNGTEGNAQVKIGTAGTMQRTLIYVNSNARTTDTTIRFRKNGSNGNQFITIGAGATGLFQDTSNTDSVSDGDLINFSITTGTGTQNIVFRLFSVEMVTTGTEYQKIFASTAGGSTAAGTTQYAAPGGFGSNLSTTEANAQIKMRVAHTIKDLKADFSGGFNAQSTVTIREDGADTSVLLNVPAGTTGWLENTNDVRAYSEGELLSLEFTNAGSSGAFIVDQLSFVVEDSAPTGTATTESVQIKVRGGTTIRGGVRFK